METCEHYYPLIDEHEGTSVCGDCGLVIESQIYENSKILQNSSNIESIEHDSENVKKNEALEILHRLNLPTDILNNLPPTKQNVNNLYDVINKISVITAKEFCAASGINSKNLVKQNQNKVLSTDIALLLDKYCKILNLSYQDYTVIKEMIDRKKNSGHPPLTIIGYYIFTHCKKRKIKLSMKTICTTLSISAISIQRYRKHELSCGS
jgi:transcription initiation factor TFIIIB Brf1 subunit/transcription initiation factor TFIIB